MYFVLCSASSDLGWFSRVGFGFFSRVGPGFSLRSEPDPIFLADAVGSESRFFSMVGSESTLLGSVNLQSGTGRKN